MESTWLNFASILIGKLFVNSIEDISWSTEAFDNLILQPGQKELITKLVRTHRAQPVGERKKAGFEDFVQGKGQGLVINLYGSPGVGKSMTAEATSECEY